MIENYTDETLITFLVWAHLAMIGIPLLFVILYEEWRDWREAHPNSILRHRSPLISARV